ncbi:MAG: hypothetical protein CO187_04990 [Zetaproteobacteria bacterium CG_4_9_14_3_um_filter_53_7]|nr:MAG: hypothetical protein CO187_04990 [Zetaproteobacteria bacterium CG_4_9_14_3_um_filter_53_7]
MFGVGIILLLLSASYHAAAEESGASIDSVPAKFRFTYDNVSLPAGEKMGFLGSTLLFDVNDWLSLGAGAYGALVGQRGGFITLGAATEVRKELLDHVEMNAGLFVGAGGGRGGFQLSGGGLMLRYHLGAKVNTMLGDFGAGVSYVDFPDGTIHSTQPYVSYEYPFSTLIGSGRKEISEWEGTTLGGRHPSEQEFMTVFRAYKIPAGVLADSGQPQHKSIQLMGIEWNNYLDDNVFLKIESEGAMGGKSNGYMQILFGMGYRFELIDGSTWVKLSSSAGVAGGGDVATGGGLIVDAVASVQQRLSDHLFAEVSAGYVRVPETTFKAISLAGKLGYHFYTPDVRDESVALSDLAGFDTSYFRIRATHQSYYKAAANWRSHHANLNVDLLGLQIDYFPHENIYLTGQGIAAYKGQAGAYMTGLVGAGLHMPLFNTPLFVDAEALVGAAGGGGLAVGSGLVWQANAGLGYQLFDDFSLLAQYGYMSAIKGNFKAKVMTLSFAYDFTLFTK